MMNVSSIYVTCDWLPLWCVRMLIINLCPFTTLDPGGAGTTQQDAPRDQNPEEIISRQLAEQSRFAYAALCSVSLGQLFTGPENRYQSHVIMTCCESTCYWYQCSNCVEECLLIPVFSPLIASNILCELWVTDDWGDMNVWSVWLTIQYSNKHWVETGYWFLVHIWLHYIFTTRGF